MTDPLVPAGPARAMNRRLDLIFLTGFMGSGKSTVGPILANTLGYEFLDVDRRIEEETGKKVVEIFQELGEPYFREIERTVLRSLAGCPSSVVSLGGGTIADDRNFRLIHESGILVYLELQEDEILKRVEHRVDRPLLHDEQGKLLSRDMLRERIRQLLGTRRPYYRRADLIIPSHERMVGRTVDAIVHGLRRLV